MKFESSVVVVVVVVAVVAVVVVFCFPVVFYDPEVVVSAMVVWLELECLLQVLLPFVQLPHLNEQRA